MPCDGLSLSVLIACEPDGVGFFCLLFEGLDESVFLRVDDIVGGVIVLEIDADAVSGGAFDVTDMAL